MLSRVLVAMDGSEMAEKGLRYALEAHEDADITVLTVVGEPSAMFGKATAIAIADDPDRSAREYAEPVFDRARTIATEHGKEVETEVRMGHPARAIIEHAEGYDAVIIGSHAGNVADRLIMGNVAETISRRSPVPVTIVR